MTAVRVIGIGSPAGDDQAGWLVVDALRRTKLIERLPCAVRLLALDRPGTQLLHEFENADIVVLVDAMCSGAPPGSLRRIDLAEFVEHRPLLSGHGLGVASALQLAKALGLMPATLWAYGIELQSTAAEHGPSQCVVVAAHRLARIITDELLQKFGLPTCSTLSA